MANQEFTHFKLFHQLLRERGWVLGKGRWDEKVRDLKKFFSKGGSERDQLVHKLSYAGLIETLSC